MSDPQSDSGGFQVSTTPTVEQLRYPVDSLLATIDTREQLHATVRELTESGFLSSEIGALTGPAAAGALVSLAEWSGLSNEDLEIKDRYEQELRAHRFVIAVLAPTDERKRIATRILEANGARFINYFDRASIHRVRS